MAFSITAQPIKYAQRTPTNPPLSSQVQGDRRWAMTCKLIELKRRLPKPVLTVRPQSTDREEWGRRLSGPNVNPSFIGDDVQPQDLSPMEKEKRRDDKTNIYLVEMDDQKSHPDSKEYEPYQNREVEHPTTNTETLLHLLKGSLGTGILAMPSAFSHSGYVIGVIGTILIGALCTYCIHVLINTSYELCRRRRVPSLTYTGVAEAALMEGPGWCKAVAPYSGHVVNAFLLIYQIGTCCVYVVFVSENLKSVVDIYLGSKENHWDVKVYMLIILLPLILINWVRNLKYLAPFSTIANVITIVSFGIILYFLFREPPTLQDRQPFGNYNEFPLFFGTVLFALEAIGVILPLENEMKTPKNFGGNCGVLNRSMIAIIILYVGMGLFGYLKYGKDVQGSITLDLPSDTEVLAQVVQCMLAFAIFITHGLACYVAIDITWNEYIGAKLRPSNKHRIIWEYAVRTVIVLITFLLAAAVPSLDLFISLFGALCLSALGLAFPAILETSAFWYQVSGATRVRLVIKNAIVFTFGVLGLVVGTYTSLQGIVNKFASGD